ncbi:ribonuclease H-like domain-containing protein [Tanacetum coccineum]
MEEMDLETAQTNTTAKLPLLKQENGNSFKLAAQTTTNADGSSTTLIPGPVTADEKTQKKNDVKARSMLLMALPNEHLLTFNQYKDAKTLFAAIQTRFGGNNATKKTQKTLLKQMYKNFSAPSTESLDFIFNRLQKIVSQLAILGKNISQEDLNLKFLRSLPSKWNTHVVVWGNKPDLDTMSFDDLYNNFKIVEQEVKGTASSSSQNLAFVSSTSSTNKVNTAYGVSTANTQVSTASTQLALLSMRTRKFFQKTSRKITINGSDTTGYDKSKVECFNCHKLGNFARECRGPRNQDSRSRNQDSSRRTINVEEISSKAMLAIDGAEEFQQPEFEGYGPKTSKSVSEDTFNEVRESLDASLVEELVSNDKLEKKTIFPTVAKINFVRPQQQEKPVRKPVKYAEMYRSQTPRGNQRNWNNQKSQQLGSDFVMYNKACFVCGSFDHVQANCNYHQRERMVSGNNYTQVNYNYSAKKAYPSAHRNIVPRAVFMKTGLRPFNTARPVNTAHPKTTVYSARPMPKAVNTARPNSAVVNAVRENQVNAVKASACWVWRPTKLNNASITFKRHNSVDARGKSKICCLWGGEPKEEELLATLDESNARQVLWIQNQMLDYGYNFMNSKIHIDNESTICIVKNLVFHSKTKHIEIIHHFIRDSNEKKLIQMIKIYTNYNVADLLTKAFDVGRFQYLIASIGMLNL